MIIGQATCKWCGYKTTTGGIGEHMKRCRKNPENKVNKAQPTEITIMDVILEKRELQSKLFDKDKEIERLKGLIETAYIDGWRFSSTDTPLSNKLQQFKQQHNL